MNWKTLCFASLAVTGLLVTGLTAQPPGPPDGDSPRRGPRPEFMPVNPLVEALDADKNHEISAEEITNAATALKKLDKNEDGKLSFDELRPRFEGRPDGFGDRGPGHRGFGDRESGDRDRRPGFGDRERDGEGREGQRHRIDVRVRRDGDRERDDDRRDDHRREAFHRGPGGPGDFGPPSPEAFVNRAMSFDADKDQKLSREELTKMAEQFGRMHIERERRIENRRPEDRRDDHREGERRDDDRRGDEDGDRPKDKPREDDGADG